MAEKGGGGRREGRKVMRFREREEREREGRERREERRGLRREGEK